MSVAHPAHVLACSQEGVLHCLAGLESRIIKWKRKLSSKLEARITTGAGLGSLGFRAYASGATGTKWKTTRKITWKLGLSKVERLEV